MFAFFIVYATLQPCYWLAQLFLSICPDLGLQRLRNYLMH